jgi:hypothetical protein
MRTVILVLCVLRAFFLLNVTRTVQKLSLAFFSVNRKVDERHLSSQ